MEKLSDKEGQLKSQYQRQWKIKNSEKDREYIQRYWENKAEKLSDPVNQARELQKQGLTQREISDRLKISLGAMNKILNKP